MHYEIYIDVVFFHKSPDRLHINQIYRNIIPMWKKQKKELFWELLQVRCFPAGSFICNLF